MKKIFLAVAVMATMMLGITSCNCAPKAELNNETDTLAYCYGVQTTRGLAEYLVQLGVDSTQMNAFLKGFVKATGEVSDAEKAEMIGMQIGQQVKEQMIPHFKQVFEEANPGVEFNEQNYVAGFIAGVNKDEEIVSTDEAMNYIEAVQDKAKEAKYADWKAENEKFLVENASKPGIQTTPSGLQYEILKDAKGEKPTETSRVKVHYTGTLIDGTVFDSSVERNQPLTIGVNQVIKGWTEALQMMTVGSKWKLYIPQELAYGAAEQRDIKPYSTLIFEVQLISIEK